MGIQKQSNSKNLDILLIASLLLLNPLLYSMNYTIGGMMPDSPAYILLGNLIIQNGQLYLDGWGHIDNGLILPPLYPALIGIFNLINEDGIYNAMLISSIIMLLTIIPIYFFAKRLSTPLVATFSVLVFQLNIHSLFFGTTILAESLFIFILSILLFYQLRYLSREKPSPISAILIGMLAATLFFSRHIGIFYLAVFPILLFPDLLKRNISAWKGTFSFFIGFLILFTPYSATLYIQSEQGPFTQHFRMYQYVVSYDKESDLASPVDAQEYLDIYKQRRENRTLTPDGSEMLGNLVETNNKKTSFRLPSLSKYFTNLSKNISLGIKTLGGGILLLFLLTTCTSFYAAYKHGHRGRILIPLTVCIYILTLSLLTGLVERYISVLYPFLTSHILIEGSILAKTIFTSKLSLQRLVIPLLALVLLAFTPKLFTKGKQYPRISENDTPIHHCKALIEPGSPVFSIHTMGAYLLGGTYRPLPNDTLEKIAIYANNTGVRWLFLRNSEVNLSEASYYKNAQWLNSQLPPTINSNYKLRCESKYKDAQLYEIAINH